MKIALLPRVSAHHAVLIALLLAALATAWRLDPSFLSPDVQLQLSTHAVEIAILALPMTLIIISGGIDLSVGSIMALAVVVFGLMIERGAPALVAAAGALATGTVAGALNGLFIARLGVHPLIVTLASLAAFRGLAEGISLGRPVSGFSEGFLRLGAGTLMGVPVPLVICVVFIIVACVITTRSTFGFRVYAIGGNENAARYAGLPVAPIKFWLYTASGLVAAIAAVTLAARRNTAKADMGAGIELEVITAVVLGGTSIYGGRGGIFGTILGVLLIHEVREFISWHWQYDELILIAIGLILVGSVLLNNAVSRRRR